MKVPILAILALILASLSCGQYITPTPTVSPVPDTATSTPEPPTQTATVPTATLPPDTAIVTASDALHVRQLPGETETVIGYLYSGNAVTLTNKCSSDPAGWAQIRWQGRAAWVNADYLSDNICEEGE